MKPNQALREEKKLLQHLAALRRKRPLPRRPQLLQTFAITPRDILPLFLRVHGTLEFDRSVLFHAEGGVTILFFEKTSPSR